MTKWHGEMWWCAKTTKRGCGEVSMSLFCVSVCLQKHLAKILGLLCLQRYTRWCTEGGISGDVPPPFVCTYVSLCANLSTVSCFLPFPRRSLSVCQLSPSFLLYFVSSLLPRSSPPYRSFPPTLGPTQDNTVMMIRSARGYSQDACSSTNAGRSALPPLWHLFFFN